MQSSVDQEFLARREVLRLLSDATTHNSEAILDLIGRSQGLDSFQQRLGRQVVQLDRNKADADARVSNAREPVAEKIRCENHVTRMTHLFADDLEEMRVGDSSFTGSKDQMVLLRDALSVDFKKMANNTTSQSSTSS